MTEKIYSIILEIEVRKSVEFKSLRLVSAKLLKIYKNFKGQSVKVKYQQHIALFSCIY